MAGRAPRELDPNAAATLSSVWVAWSMSLNLLHQFPLLDPVMFITPTSRTIPRFLVGAHQVIMPEKVL